MTNIDPFGPDPGTPGKRPWFGPKTVGFGYGPRTWQGYLLVAVGVIPIIIVASITGGHSPLMAIAIIPAVLVGIFARFQGRR
jgi:hypothetical protein